jgi:(p)ppGpp synthase/HD superfamily hydrolase
MKLNDKLNVAKQFSAMMHADKGQMYGKEPYSYHLQKVVDVLLANEIIDRDILAAGYLHDIMEDVGIDYTILREMFGERTAQLVSMVTDEPGKNRKERKAATYAKIALDLDAVMIKLADRIANIQFSIDTENERMFTMYKLEHPEFCDKLRTKGQHGAMWGHLENLIFIGNNKFKKLNPVGAFF